MKIDYVVPMVFPDDLQWRRDYARANGMFAGTDGSEVTNVRYRTWGTEELLIRCIRKNLPWVRTIHILLARESQVQPWMKDYLAAKPQDTLKATAATQPTEKGTAIKPPHTLGTVTIKPPHTLGAVTMKPPHTLGAVTMKPPHTGPQVRVVLHQDFMPKEVLPTFNSRAIEMYLHRIPGLSEHFLYGNDDMFPLTPMREDDFFRAAAIKPPRTLQATAVPLPTEKDTLPCLHWRMKAYNTENWFHRACMNGLNFVAGEFGKHYDARWMHFGHTVVPMLRSTCEMFWQRWPEKMQASVTRFRMPQNYNQYIYSWWQVLSGQYVDQPLKCRYLSTNNTEADICDAIREAKGILCINDNDALSDIRSIARTARAELSKRIDNEKTN